MISNFRRVLNVVCFLVDNFPASEFYKPTFRNTVPSSRAGRYEEILHTYLPMKMEHTQCSETSAHKIQTLGNYPEESTQKVTSVSRRAKNCITHTYIPTTYIHTYYIHTQMHKYIHTYIHTYYIHNTSTYTHALVLCLMMCC